MAIPVGAHAPHITLLNTDKEKVTFPNHGEVTVLVFYPAAFTSVCTAELCSFRDAIANYNDVDAKVYGISVDLPFTLAEFKEQQKLSFDLLSDHAHEAIKAYHALVVHYPNATAWTYWQTPWYPAQAAVAKQK